MQSSPPSPLRSLLRAALEEMVLAINLVPSPEAQHHYRRSLHYSARAKQALVERG